MNETELKFQVPSTQVAAVLRAVRTAGARRTRLQAHYHDTPDRRLAAAGFALRLRKEGRQWVQTLKGPGDGLMQRLEHNAAVAGAGVPQIDLSRHDGTAVAEALRKALPDADALVMLFGTDVQRSHRLVRSGGAVVELAFDQGHVFSGTARAPLCELEFELVRGTPQALLALAGRWVQRHGLWLDSRTKAERGDRLARAEPLADAVHASPVRLSPQATAEQALQAMVRSCLAQIVPNGSDIAAGTFTPEHVHQMRVGLRRLRTALRVFGRWSPQVDDAWNVALADVFALLGAVRDRDALAESLLPALEGAGAPTVELGTTSEAPDPGELLRRRDYNLLVLSLIAFVQAPVPAPTQGRAPAASPAEQWGAMPPLPESAKAAAAATSAATSAAPAATSAASKAAPAGPGLKALARKRLARLHRQVTADVKHFERLPEEDQHRVRKRLKRLRYSVEFTASLFGKQAVKRYMKALRPAQERLGEYNDLCVAQAAFQARVDDDPQAWFAIGWLAGQRPLLLARCAKALQELHDAPVFWKGR